MKKNQYFFCFLLFLISFNSMSQNLNLQHIDSVSIYEIKDSNFIAILDSFIQFESKYYPCNNPTFIITNLDPNNDVIELMSGYCSDSLIALNGDNLNFCGVLFHNNCQFLIRGRKLINERILMKTSLKIPVFFTNQSKIESNENIELFIDDSFFPTRRIYKFVDGKYFLGYSYNRLD